MTDEAFRCLVGLQKCLTAARQRPELAGASSPFTAAVPQIYADVDRDKVLRQGVALGGWQA